MIDKIDAVKDVLASGPSGPNGNSAAEVAEYSEYLKSDTPENLGDKILYNLKIFLDPQNTERGTSNKDGSGEQPGGFDDSDPNALTPSTDTTVLGKISMWFEKFWQSVASFFTGIKDQANDLQDSMREEHPNWFTENVFGTSISRGAALIIGTMSALMILFLYKMLRRFIQNKNTESYNSVMDITKTHFMESMYFSKGIFTKLKESGEDKIEASKSLIDSAKKPALEMLNFVESEPKESDGKIVRFLKKISPLAKIIILTSTGVALAVASYFYLDSKGKIPGMDDMMEKFKDEPDKEKFSNDGKFGMASKFGEPNSASFGQTIKPDNTFLK